MTLVENDYCWNRKFREYVDKYAKEHDITPEEALAAAIRAADRHDHTWSGITHEKIRRPWEMEKPKQMTLWEYMEDSNE